MMNKNIICKSAAISLIALAINASAARAGDQAKAIINGIDPKSMNELLEAVPDAARCRAYKHCAHIRQQISIYFCLAREQSRHDL